MGQILRPDDRVHFDGCVWTVTAVGSTVRLADDGGRSQLVVLSFLLASPGFELLSGNDALHVNALEPVSMLDALPDDVIQAARTWELHVIEAETGLPPGCTRPQAEFDPATTTAEQRDKAKAAELTAIGQPTSARTVKRMRGRYRDEGSGVWSIADTLALLARTAESMSGSWPQLVPRLLGRQPARPARRPDSGASSKPT